MAGGMLAEFAVEGWLEKESRRKSAQMFPAGPFTQPACLHLLLKIALID
jgi:hypothetical protein